eukprot:scaffold63621_cov51-Phaeocystis_antarctica.AAC.1
MHRASRRWVTALPRSRAIPPTPRPTCAAASCARAAATWRGPRRTSRRQRDSTRAPSVARPPSDCMS